MSPYLFKSSGSTRAHRSIRLALLLAFPVAHALDVKGRIAFNTLLPSELALGTLPLIGEQRLNTVDSTFMAPGSRVILDHGAQTAYITSEGRFDLYISPRIMSIRNRLMSISQDEREGGKAHTRGHHTWIYCRSSASSLSLSPLFSCRQAGIMTPLVKDRDHRTDVFGLSFYSMSTTQSTSNNITPFAYRYPHQSPLYPIR